MWIMGEWSVNFYRFFCVDTISISKIIMQPVMCKEKIRHIIRYFAINSAHSVAEQVEY
uniref:Uncharacterized protein n=1 Tax=Physcomitrium patens TaxID=3218 RepID=A0A2K1KZQ2_PHYPA|nr:hypothetical protein PHYPA_002068 [Physcomitrium patens]